MKAGWRNLGTGIRRAAERLRKTLQPRVGPPEPAAPPKVGLALGGGFARALAHVGVMKVLEEENIKVDFIAGTSAGGLLAGAYASGATTEEIAAIGRRLSWQDFGKWTLSKMGLATNHRMEALVRRLFRKARFKELHIPLAIVAADLATGKPAVFTEGDLSMAVRASCAYPGFFLPVHHDGRLLVDGGLVQTVPTRAVTDMGANIVIGVTLNNINPDVELRHIADVLSRSFAIAMQAAEPIWRREADVVVEPDVSLHAWDDFEKTDEIIAAGEAAMRAQIPRLRELLNAAHSRTARAG